MKHIGIYTGILAALTLPALAFAQTSGSVGTLQTLIGIEDRSKIFEMISTWSVLIIAFTTTIMVWSSGRKMHGGVFGKVLTLFSVGMTAIFLSVVTQIPFFQNMSPTFAKTAQDLLYIIGFIIMGLAANKLLGVIKGE